GSRDQVHDARRIRRDHAGAWRLLRPVVEIEADVRLVLEVEAEALDRVHADLDGAVLRVRRLERGETPQVGDVVRGRHLCALRAEHPPDPAVAAGEESWPHVAAAAPSAARTPWSRSALNSAERSPAASPSSSRSP